MVLDSIFSARNSSKVMTMNMVRILLRQKRGIKVLHINAQSLNNKVDEFRCVFQNADVDIVCISETWLRWLFLPQWLQGIQTA